MIAFHHSKVSASDKTRIFEMSRFLTYFHFGLALLALSLVNQTTANKPRGNISKGAPTTWNINNLYFYAGPTKRIETLLMKMKKQLSQIGSDIKKLKGTSKGNENLQNISQFFYSLCQFTTQAIGHTAITTR